MKKLILYFLFVIGFFCFYFASNIGFEIMVLFLAYTIMYAYACKMLLYIFLRDVLEKNGYVKKLIYALLVCGYIATIMFYIHSVELEKAKNQGDKILQSYQAADLFDAKTNEENKKTHEIMGLDIP